MTNLNKTLRPEELARSQEFTIQGSKKTIKLTNLLKAANECNRI